MNEAINDSKERVQAVYLFEEGLSIRLELVEMVRGKYVNEELIQIHSS